jgi:hypothetical protein
MPRYLAAIALVCAGCEAPAAAVPPTTPRHAGAWQQFCEQSWNVPQASALVSARGAEGWELVAMYNGVLCYKRPVVESTGARPASPGTPVTMGDTPKPPAAPASGYVPLVRDPGF